MTIKKVKKVTTNAIIYLTLSSVVAGYGLYKQNMACLAFSMWMIQMANFFKRSRKRCKRKHTANTDDMATADVTVIS
jgi:hypothetical protein